MNQNLSYFCLSHLRHWFSLDIIEKYLLSFICIDFTRVIYVTLNVKIVIRGWKLILIPSESPPGCRAQWAFKVFDYDNDGLLTGADIRWNLNILINILKRNILNTNYYSQSTHLQESCGRNHGE